MYEMLRRALRKCGYAGGMGRHRRVQPERRPDGLDNWVGMWVAVKDGNVVAAAHNSRDLVPMVRSKGPAAAGAVAQYVPERSDDVVIGVG